MLLLGFVALILPVTITYASLKSHKSSLYRGVLNLKSLFGLL